MKKRNCNNLLHDSLIQSIQTLQKSKYGKGNKNKLTSIQSALKLANPLFTSTTNSDNTKHKVINFRNIEQAEQIPLILDEFANNFENQCIEKNGVSAKNYSLFSVTLLKIIKTLNADKKRGLLSAHGINILNNMFVKYPVEYKKIEIRDPLRFVFVIIELAIDAEQNLSKNYEFDIILLRQIVPLMQRYHMKYDNALLQINDEFKKMSKFRLTVSIGERHKEIVQIFLQYAMTQLPLEDKISRAKNIIDKIIFEDSDSVVLEYYGLLKLCFNDKEICPHLVKIVETKNRTGRRFANTILDEISKL
ncbi:MAG: hypothetical protein IIB02_00205 [Thaumarchaeota archaeon]|nr:hypothetical protein [Nitrososphaerota archaeon]